MEALFAKLSRFWWMVAAGSALVVAGLVYLALPSHAGRILPPPRARVYTSFDACLLTDTDGVSGSAAAPVWAGMQAASLKTSGKVSFLAVAGPDTVANAIPYLNTLVQRRCDLVLAVGAAEVGAVEAQARAFGSARFAVVGGPAGPNVSTVSHGSATQESAAVQDLVTRAAAEVKN